MTALPAVLADASQWASLEERICAATALGAADPRIGAEVTLPAGSFLSGDSLTPSITESYRIDLVAVTVSQFAKFIEAGYAERSFWTDEGWDWRAREAIACPRFWNDPDWAAYLGPNQPVVGVSFHEATAYARFAGRRLPDEFEWERAARGEDGRRYPWGNEWDPMLAHHRGGLRHTLPVGCFPGGTSPHGLFDAAGNVWEWCQGGSAELRPARGGSWNAHPPQLGCASRNAWPPEARFSNIGFRTAH